MSSEIKRPVALVILDGWGIGRDEPGNAVLAANYGIQKLGDVRPILQGIEHRAMVIWGLEDRILTLDTPLTYAKLMPSVEVIMYPKTGHWVQWERAEDFNRNAIEFLNRL